MDMYNYLASFKSINNVPIPIKTYFMNAHKHVPERINMYLNSCVLIYTGFYHNYTILHGKHSLV